MISPARSEGFGNPPTKSSANVQKPHKLEQLDALSEELARLGSLKGIHPSPEGPTSPPVTGSEWRKTAPPISLLMPEVSKLQWEWKIDGSVEAWHSPEGKRNRGGKTYIGRIGKRRLAELSKLSTDELQFTIHDWIAKKRTEKGIQLN